MVYSSIISSRIVQPMWSWLKTNYGVCFHETLLCQVCLANRLQDTLKYAYTRVCVYLLVLPMQVCRTKYENNCETILEEEEEVN